MHKLTIALVTLRAYAEAAEEMAAHANRQAIISEGAARRLWQEQAERERIRATAYRTSVYEFQRAMGEISEAAAAEG